MNFLGFGNVLSFFKNFAREDELDLEQQLKNDTGSVAPPKNNDGAYEIETDLTNQKYASVFQQFYSGQDPAIQNKEQLINTYRGIMSYPEVENAVSEIIDDAIVNEQGKDIITLDLAKTDFSKAIQDKIVEEFDNVLNIYDFDNMGARLFRDWYVDSRIYFHKIMHKDESKGIRELRQLDPRSMELIRESITETLDGGVKVFRGYREFSCIALLKMAIHTTGRSTSITRRLKSRAPLSCMRILVWKIAVTTLSDICTAQSSQQTNCVYWKMRWSSTVSPAHLNAVCSTSM